MLLDGNSQEARLVENPCLDVKDATSVVGKKALIVFKKGNPVRACMYTKFEDPTNTVKSSLPTLPNNDFLENFSVCKLSNKTKFILSGGENENGNPSAKVHALDTLMWKWEMKALPDLNIARLEHSSTSLGEAVYVACGEGDKGTRLNSVERLWMGVSGDADS